VTLYNADCLDVIALLPAIDAVVTDPPYGIGFASQPTTGGRARGQAKEMWDEERAEGLQRMLALAPVLVVWGGNYYALPPSRGWLSWYKPDAPPSMASLELAWTNRDQNARQISWSIAATNAERVGHPTQKPVRVMAWCMEQAKVPKGALVLDPYMGSGTTGIACIRLGMNFIGIERDAAHYKTACDRIAHELDGALL
jgi:site-specific DNA-methyltransferase (adenine-specific)/modification methylase